jgi:hypothetical protein
VGGVTTVPRGTADPDLVLGRYRLLERLGAGAFGVVWHACDVRLERDVALKEIVLDPGGVPFERVEREARAAARLAHPAIVALYELGRDERAVYLAFELVRGQGLGELLARGLVSDRDLARMGALLCDALAHAHARGVVHRDVKPHNVVVAAEPTAAAGWVKLTDFGVAHLAAGESLTGTGEVLGTLAYMAPEQAQGRAVTGAADVYGLALTLYEGWTGENPRRGEGALALARRPGRALPRLRSRRRDLPPALGRAIDAALDPRPEHRPTPAELGAALEGAAPLLADEGGLEAAAAEGLTLVLEPGSRAEATTRLDPERDAFDGAPTRLDPPPLGPRRRVGREPPAHASPPGRRPPGPSPLGRWRGRPAPAERGVPDAAARPPAARARALGARLAAAATAGGAVATVLLVTFVPDALALAAAATMAVLLFPRLGWAAAGVGLVGWLALGVGVPGAALVIATALALPPVLMPRAGVLWPLPVLAAAAGAIGVGPVYLALAGRAGTLWRRAALGLGGAIALLAEGAVRGGEEIRGVRAVEGLELLPEAPEDGWQASVTAALDQVLIPLGSGVGPALALAWAGLAVALPALVRGRARTRALGALAWSAAAIAAHTAVAETAGLDVSSAAATGTVAGVLAAALLAATMPSRAGALLAVRRGERL